MNESRRRDKRIATVAALVVLLLALSLAGCSTPHKPDENLQEGLPAWADEAAVTQQAREVVELVNARSFDQLAAQWNDPNVDAEKLEQNLGPVLDQFGPFKGYAEAKYAQSEAGGRSVATVIQRVDYEKEAAQFNVSIYEGGDLAGLYLYKVEGEAE